MSIGPPKRKENPRSASSSWNDERPKSNRTPSTGPMPASRRTSPRLAKFAWTTAEPVADARFGTEVLGPAYGFGVGIEREYPAIRRRSFKDLASVATAAERGVDVGPAGPGRQVVDRLAQEDRNVPSPARATN